MIKCPIKIDSIVLANIEECKQNLNKNLKNKNHNKKFEEKKNLPNLVWSLAFKCSMFAHLHTQEGGRGKYQLQFKNQSKQQAITSNESKWWGIVATGGGGDWVP